MKTRIVLATVVAAAALAGSLGSQAIADPPQDPTIVAANWHFYTGDSDLPAPLNQFAMGANQRLFLANGDGAIPHSIISDALVCPVPESPSNPCQEDKVPLFASSSAGVLAPVREVSFVGWAKAAGTYPFYCGVHLKDGLLGMTGTLVLT